MKSKVAYLYGKNDIRLEEIELPKIKENEILASVVTDSICMSTLKLANLGNDHKKSPDDLSVNPIIVGHEFCGDIIEVGKKYKDKFKVGDKYVVQANLQLGDRSDCPGYSYPYVGGNATYVIINKDILENDCLITYKGDSYYEGSLVEPLSCVIGAFKANYHLKTGTYEHEMGIKPGGNCMIMGGTGPMGLLAIDYALNGPINPKNLVITHIDDDLANKLKELYPSNEKTKVTFINVNGHDDQSKLLVNDEIKGYDDVFVMLPFKDVVSAGVKVLNPDGCLNFFAGPKDKEFSTEINFYDLHYNFTHFVGTSGGNTDDMREAVSLIESRQVNVSNIVSHILGLNDVPEVTLNQDKIKGGKKVVYTHKNFSYFSVNEQSFSPELDEILKRNNNVWNLEAEQYVLNN